MVRLVKNWVNSHVIKAISSFLVNSVYYIRNYEDMKLAKKRMSNLELEIKNINDAYKFMSSFRWTPEKFDWTPWTVVVVDKFMKNEYDDCDGAAIMWKFLFSCCGIESDFYHLRGKRSGHAVTITKDKKLMGSNKSLYKFRDPKNWKNELLNNCWNGEYDIVYKNLYK